MAQQFGAITDNSILYHVSSRTIGIGELGGKVIHARALGQREHGVCRTFGLCGAAGYLALTTPTMSTRNGDHVKLRDGWLYLITCSTHFTMMLVVFAVSRELAEEGRGLAFMGLTGAVIAASLAVSCLLGGRLSDRFGRRRLIIFGCVLMIVVPPIAGARWYLLAYLLAGIGGGAIFPALTAWLTSGTSPRSNWSRVSGRLVVFCVAWNLGILSAQITGGILYDIDRLAPFIAAMLVGLVNLGAAIMASPIPLIHPDFDIDEHGDHFDHRARSATFARLAWIANLAGAFSMSMVLHLLPRLVVDIGIPPDAHGFMLATMRLLVMGVYLLMYGLNFWHHRFSTALVSQLIAVLGLTLIALAGNAPILWLGLAGLAQLMGYNYFASLYYTTSGSTEEQRGAATGIHEATIAAGFTLGSTIGGLVGQHTDLRAPYALSAAVILALALVQLTVYLRRNRVLGVLTIHDSRNS